MPIAADVPDDEFERLEKLFSYRVMDSAPESAFDRITDLVTDQLGAPIALVSLVDDHRQWFKSCVGLPVRETPKNLAFCAYTVLHKQVFLVEDAARDPRFADSPLVIGPPYIRTYVGAPLISPDGHALGSLCAIYDTVRSISDADIAYLQILADIVVDALEHRAALAAAEEARRAADEANRAKSDFLAMMSHEIRTPMTSVLGALDLLAREDLSSDQTQLVADAGSSARSLLGILNDILDYSKIQAGRVSLAPMPLDVAALQDGLERTFASMARQKEVAFSVTAQGFDVDADVLVDENRLRQILVNLIGNALKFTHTGSVQAHLMLRRHENDWSLEARVDDTGIGIPQDKLLSIFDAFTQAEPGTMRRYGGTGLGLSITRQLVELMGGSIHAENRQGGGTRFIFDVAVSLADKTHSGAIKTAFAESGGNAARPGIRLLLAEDNKINQQLISKSLEKRGFNVDIVSDGEEALTAFERSDYDLILMDVHMPKRDGVSATQALRSSPRGRTIPIIALTADAMAGDRERYLGYGMNDHVAKPVDFPVLVERINALVAG